MRRSGLATVVAVLGAIGGSVGLQAPASAATCGNGTVPACYTVAASPASVTTIDPSDTVSVMFTNVSPSSADLLQTVSVTVPAYFTYSSATVSAGTAGDIWTLSPPTVGASGTTLTAHSATGEPPAAGTASPPSAPLPGQVELKVTVTPPTSVPATQARWVTTGAGLIQGTTGLSSFTNTSTNGDPTVTVTAGAYDHLALAGLPTSISTAPATATVTVTPQDKNNNPFPNQGPASVALTVLSSSPASNANPNIPGSGVVISGTGTVDPSTGSATFTVSFQKPGVFTLQASDGGSPAKTAQATTTASVTAASQLVFTAQPSNGVTGTALSPVQVTAEDQSGNTYPGYTSPVTLDVTGGGASVANLPQTVTPASGTGQASFTNVVFSKPGTYTLSASDGTLSATSGSFSVGVGASQLVFTTEPANTKEGQPVNVAVSIEDAYGNVDTGNSSPVTLSLAHSPNANTSSNLPQTVAATNGVASFSVVINTAGSGYTLGAAASGLAPGTSTGFNVGVQATHLVFSTQPTDTAVNSTMTAVSVSAEDNNGQVDSTYNGPVTLAIGTDPNGSTTTGDCTSGSPSNLPLTAQAVNGVATFSNIDFCQKGAGWTLTASDGSGNGLTGATSNSFTTSDSVATCQGSQACNTSAGSQSNTTLSVSLTPGTSSAPSLLEVTVGFPNPQSPCFTGSQELGQPGSYIQTDSTRFSTINYLVPIPNNASADPSKYGICWTSTSPFTAKNRTTGASTPATYNSSTGQYYGFLPTCSASATPTTVTANTPCLKSLVKVDENYNNIFNNDDYFKAVVYGGDLPNIGLGSL